MTGALSKLEEIIAEAGGADAFERLWLTLAPEEQLRLSHDWTLIGRPSQQLPVGAWWWTWLWLGGRGVGKTRTAAETIHIEVQAGRAGRIALISPTAASARDVLVEGESGLLATAPPWFRPVYEPSKRRVTWPNGAIASLYSADEPDRLRGPQHDLGILDELAAYFDPQAVWDMFKLGLRIGQRPRAAIFTTPRPIPLLRKLIKDPTVVVTRGRTVENAHNLAPGFLEAITAQYGGTRLGRQELEAELLEDNPGALWRLDAIDAARVKVAPDLRRICVGVDPAVSTNVHSNETGIIVAGVGDCACRGPVEKHAFVLDDESGVWSPAEWARRVKAAYSRWGASRVVAEINQGGQLVEANLRANGAANLPLRTVHASKGKAIRAEPVSALYEQGKAHHVGGFARLEDQMTQWNPMEDATSPDRVDALVWVLTELMLKGGGGSGTFYDHGEPILKRRI